MHMVWALGIACAGSCSTSKRSVATFKQKRYKTPTLSHTRSLPTCKESDWVEKNHARFIEHTEQNLSMTRLNHPNPAPTPTPGYLLPILRATRYAT